MLSTLVYQSYQFVDNKFLHVELATLIKIKKTFLPNKLGNIPGKPKGMGNWGIPGMNRGMPGGTPLGLSLESDVGRRSSDLSLRSFPFPFSFEDEVGGSDIEVETKGRPFLPI